jgi:nicotinate-nucleotide adenylyltransferase
VKLGIYGGAFDPPHNAHVALARAAVDQLKLDQLRVLPTGDAWHKARELSPATDRVAMAQVAFRGIPKCVVDERETRRVGATYTIDTLREIQREVPGAELFLVMGEDQVRAFKSWREWEEIARIAKLCVAARPGAGLGRTDIAFIPLQLPSMPESATEIRRMVADGEDVSSLVPAPVASYIASHPLYSQGN